MKNLFISIGNASLFRIIKFFTRAQLFMQLKVGLLNTYAPNAFVPREKILKDERASYGRLDAINRFLPEDAQPTVLDVGCNLGFFTFNMAKRGGFSLGIDYGRNEILAAKALSVKHSVNNIAFAQMEITPENAFLLPKVDMVICLSVFHHWIRKLGEAESLKIMKGLAGSANKYFVFDTGQPNEKNVEWNKCVEFMNPDINAWAEDYLEGLGFSKVVNLGNHRTSLSDVPRTLFIAVKDTNR